MTHDSSSQDLYELQRSHEFSRKVQGNLPSCYTNPGSVDAWRHRRMHETIKPLIDAYPGATWITMGDGRYGSDAFYLEQSKCDVLATSLTEDALSIAKEYGYIQKYKLVNAESIDFPDDSFDFVYCKESYHHFPRPYVAFYEMLRISRIAVVLVEPQEGSKRALNWAKDLIKTGIRGDQSTEFEPAGNFIFRVNVREIMKMMKGLSIDTVVAMKPFNDFFFRRFSSSQSSGLSIPNLVTRLAIAAQDFLCRARFLDYGLAAVMAFKTLPETRIRKSLIQHGFRLYALPTNPYRHKATGQSLQA